MYCIHSKAYTKDRDVVTMNLKFVFFSQIILGSLCFENCSIIEWVREWGGRFLGSPQHIYLIILLLSSFKK